MRQGAYETSEGSRVGPPSRDRQRDLGLPAGLSGDRRERGGPADLPKGVLGELRQMCGWEWKRSNHRGHREHEGKAFDGFPARMVVALNSSQADAAEQFVERQLHADVEIAEVGIAG